MGLNHLQTASDKHLLDMLNQVKSRLVEENYPKLSKRYNELVISTLELSLEKIQEEINGRKSNEEKKRGNNGSNI